MRRKLNPDELEKLETLIRYSDVYEISIQFWPEQTAVYIEKDGVELQSYGGGFYHAIGSSIKYLKRINGDKVAQ